MTCRRIIFPVLVVLQLLLSMAPAHADTAGLAGRADTGELRGVVKVAAQHIASLPVRMQTSSLLPCIPPVTGERMHGGRPVRPDAGTGDVPRFLASALRSSFLRHSVLLI